MMPVDIFKTLILAILCAVFFLYAPTRTMAADSSAWGTATLAPYTSAGGMQCEIFSSPTYGGYCIGNSEWAFQNDITPRESATYWCVHNYGHLGYKIGFSLEVWYTGGGQCVVAGSQAASDVNGWAISHHCMCMYRVKCCR